MAASQEVLAVLDEQEREEIEFQKLESENLAGQQAIQEVFLENVAFYKT